MSYELLLGDYSELEQWVEDGVDFAFTRMPTKMDLDVRFIEDDELMAVVPKDNPYADAERFPTSALADYLFMLLEKGGKAEIGEFFDRDGVESDVVFQTWDDYAILSMVESGFGISILPSLILRRIPYDVCRIPLDPPAFRHICIATKKGRIQSIASKCFMEYIDCRRDENVG